MTAVWSNKLALNRGLALISVLWLVAALSIIITGVAQTVKTEVRTVSQARQAVQGGAIGDAAIQIALQAAKVAPDKFNAKARVMGLDFQGLRIRVESRPLTGFLDINVAPKSLLQAAFQYAGAMEPKAAEMLAQATIDHRAKYGKPGVQNSFEVPEDLLPVPGMNYDLYVKLKNIITTDSNSGGKVNPYAAPYELLIVLAEGNVALAAKFLAMRDAAAEVLDTTSFNGGFIDNSTSSRIHFSASVPLQGGQWVNSFRTVDLSGGEKEGFPWRTIYSGYALKHHP